MTGVSNAEIAAALNELADLLELEQQNPFRVRAYRSAAQTVRGYPRAFETLIDERADLAAIPTIGRSLARKIETLVRTGSLPALEAARRRTPPVLAELMHLRGLGPARVRALHDALKIRSTDDILRAAKAHRIRSIPGFGARSEARILESLSAASGVERRYTRLDARSAALPLVAFLRRLHGVNRVVVAGSYRRGLDTIGDLDILVTAQRGAGVTARFVAYDGVAEIVSEGQTRATVVLRSGLQVDLRVVPKVSYGAAMHYFTGSKSHNIAVRGRARRLGLTINEYGVFRGDKRIAGRTESEVFEAVGLPFIPPELREHSGELDAALAGKLPTLIDYADIRGDLHCHTKATDGTASLAQMAEAARRLGYEYLAITDHSRHVTIANGLTERRLRAQLDEIDRLNDRFDDFVILKSCEVDVLEDGSLDLPDRVLTRLDFAVAAVHYAFNLTRKRQTRRVRKALDNPNVRVLAHPTGRLINERPGYEIDLDEVLDAAARSGVAVELNAHPDRLDLNAEACRAARDRGVTVALGSDAHSVATLEFMRFGVVQARRGWLEADDVLNTRSLAALRAALAH